MLGFCCCADAGEPRQLGAAKAHTCGQQKIGPAQVTAAKMIERRQPCVSCGYKRRLDLADELAVIDQLETADPCESDTGGAMTPPARQLRGALAR